MTLTPSQAAKKIGTSRRSIMRAIDNHKLPAKRNNRNQWQITENDLAQWAPTGHAHSKKETAPTFKNSAIHELQTRIAVLEAELFLERQMKEMVIQDRDTWRNQAQLLSRPWWKRLAV